MNETTQNFWQALREWNPEPPRPVFFRLYYDDNGKPICYSQEDLPGNYIDVTPMELAISNHNVRVIAGRLEPIPPRVSMIKLVPSDAGTPCDPRDVTVISHAPAQHWKRKTHETS
jgi:hypothetical protein